ncbi:MAG TPA: hypothetical protein VHK70_11020 [Burkholderiaceae bacterium]|nr:hypothetical protein [Burkholderiaceae bacterium]
MLRLETSLVADAVPGTTLMLATLEGAPAWSCHPARKPARRMKGFGILSRSYLYFAAIENTEAIDILASVSRAGRRQ